MKRVLSLMALCAATAAQAQEAPVNPIGSPAATGGGLKARERPPHVDIGGLKITVPSVEVGGTSLGGTYFRPSIIVDSSGLIKSPAISAVADPLLSLALASALTRGRDVIGNPLDLNESRAMIGSFFLDVNGVNSVTGLQTRSDNIFTQPDLVGFTLGTFKKDAPPEKPGGTPNKVTTGFIGVGVDFGAGKASPALVAATTGGGGRRIRSSRGPVKK